jgi:hypothetical protein
MGLFAASRFVERPPPKGKLDSPPQ